MRQVNCFADEQLGMVPASGSDLVGCPLSYRVSSLSLGLLLGVRPDAVGLPRFVLEFFRSQLHFNIYAWHERHRTLSLIPAVEFVHFLCVEILARAVYPLLHVLVYDATLGHLECHVIGVY